MNIAKVYDANVYVNNASKHGLASEITAPTITALMTDYKAMGMIGSAEFFNGFDKLETTIKWTYPDNEAQKAFGNFLKPVDLMIRTSGEERLSNFLLWQCAYAEFYFTDTLFPDFTKECFDKALAEYARRDRRMGGNTKK
jgi:hypothetical protein